MTRIKGLGSQNYTVNVDENPFAWARNYELVISNPLSAQVPDKTCVISQAAAPGYFNLSTNSVILNYTAGSSASVNLTTNAKWTASTDASTYFTYKKTGGPSGNIPATDLKETLQFIAVQENGDSNDEWSNITKRINYSPVGAPSSYITVTQLVKSKGRIIAVTNPNEYLSDLEITKSAYSFQVQCTRPYKITIPNNINWVYAGSSGTTPFNQANTSHPADYNSPRTIYFRLAKNTTSSCRYVTFTVQSLDPADNINLTISYMQRDAAFFTWTEFSGGDVRYTSFDDNTSTLTTNYSPITESSPVKLKFKTNIDWAGELLDDAFTVYGNYYWVYFLSNTPTSGVGDPSCKVGGNQNFQISLGVKEFKDYPQNTDLELTTRIGHININRTWEGSKIPLKTITVKQTPAPVFTMSFNPGYPTNFDYKGGITYVLVRACDYMTWRVYSPSTDETFIEAQLTNVGIS